MGSPSSYIISMCVARAPSRLTKPVMAKKMEGGEGRESSVRKGIPLRRGGGNSQGEKRSKPLAQLDLVPPAGAGHDRSTNNRLARRRPLSRHPGTRLGACDAFKQLRTKTQVTVNPLASTRAAICLATSPSLGDAVLPFAAIDNETWLSTRCTSRRALD